MALCKCGHARDVHGARGVNKCVVCPPNHCTAYREDPRYPSRYKANGRPKNKLVPREKTRPPGVVWCPNCNERLLRFLDGHRECPYCGHREEKE